MRKNLWQSSAYLNKLFLFLLFLFFSVGAYSQTVTGIVRDDENKAVPGATVTVKGTSRATVTNNSGAFSISAGGSDILVVTFVGFLTTEIPLNNRNEISVSMIRGATNMNEVVVVALGIKRES